jgi:manganese/zinc/iron transport system permease protein
MTYLNPYTGQTFLGFLFQLFERFWAFAKGDVSPSNMASDEIQIIVLVGIAVSSALVGSFLVLRRMTMLANALSHTILIGIVAVFLFTHETVLEGGHLEIGHNVINIQAMLIAALAMGLITTFLTEFLTKTIGLQEDASTGIVFTSLFALGIILVTTLTRSAHIGAEVVMGNVDALHIDDVKLVLIILAMNVILFALFFKEYKITTFDPAFSQALGFSTAFFNYLLMVQVSATAIGAFRAVGVLMVLAFITGPVLTARLLTHDLKKMIWAAIGLGSLAAVLGVALSRHFLSAYNLALSTAGIVVCVITGIFFLTVAFKILQQKTRSA